MELRKTWNRNGGDDDQEHNELDEACRADLERGRVGGAAAASAGAAGPANRQCEQGDRGRLIRYEKVGSYPTAHDARAHFDEWIAFYQDAHHQFPEDLPVTFEYGFDSYKVTYCTDDAVLPGQSVARTTTVTDMVSVPRKSGPLPTVAYVHGTSVSFYDAPSNPNTVGDFSDRGESFEGPPSTAVFAGNGFIYIAPDYLGLGDSTIPRHRYFHAATEASSAIDLMAAARNVLADLRVRQNGELFIFGFSQGGHSALALQRELERMRVKVDGTAVVGAVFDVERWFLGRSRGRTASRRRLRQLPASRVRRHLRRLRIDRRRLPPAIRGDCRESLRHAPLLR